MIASAIVVAVMTAICFVFAGRIFELLLRPAAGIKPVFTEITEMISTYMIVSLVAGIVLALPFLIYQLVMFLSPALTPKEKRYLYGLLPGVTISFLAGAAFGYFILLPPALTFLLTFGSNVAVPMIKIGNYISVVTRLLFAIGMAFELPIVIFLLAKVGVVKPEMLAKNRRWGIVGAFVIAAIITPTMDPINQSLVAAPLLVLFEISIWLAKIARPVEKPVILAEAPE